MLISTFGTLWNPDVVDWGPADKKSRPKLWGSMVYNKKKITIDVCDGIGIYVLYKDYEIVYVGRAAGATLSGRLKNHLTNRMEGRWDSFSFYLVNKVSKTSAKLSPAPSVRQVKPKETTESIEALLIEIANPPLNRRMENLKGAVELEQVETRAIKTNIDYLVEISNTLKDLLDRNPDLDLGKLKEDLVDAEE